LVSAGLFADVYMRGHASHFYHAAQVIFRQFLRAAGERSACTRLTVVPDNC
jgi:hypothetical protein